MSLICSAMIHLLTRSGRGPSAKLDVRPPRATALSKNCKKNHAKPCYNMWIGPRRDFEMQSGSPPLLDWPLLEWHKVLDSRDAEETRAFLNTMAFRFRSEEHTSELQSRQY